MSDNVSLTMINDSNVTLFIVSNVKSVLFSFLSQTNIIERLFIHLSQGRNDVKLLILPTISWHGLYYENCKFKICRTDVNERDVIMLRM